MAKNWVYDKAAKTLTRNYSEKVIDKNTGKESIKETASPLVCEMEALYISVNFRDFDEVEEWTAVNGLKQKLDDCTARSKDMTLTDPEKREIQEELWLRLCESRKWNSEGKKGPKSESVGLKLVVPEFLALGWSAEKIAKVMQKPVDVIKKFIATGEEEDSD